MILTPCPLSEGGVTQKTIDKIPTIIFRSNLLSTTELDKIECCICLQPFQDEEELRMFFCFHRYHKNCIDPWLKKKSLCPNCHFNIRSINPPLETSPPPESEPEREESPQILTPP